MITSQATQPVLARFGPDGERLLWVFILGNYNSGTTLLYELLRSQSKVCSLPWEGSRLTHHFSDPNDYGWPRMWHACIDKMRDAESELNTKSSRQVKRQWNWAAQNSAGVCIEKSITNATRIPFLANNFTPAFFIHIVRNPYSSSEGIQRKAAPDPKKSGSGLSRYSLAMCAQQWVDSNRMIETGLKNLDSVRISYEDLCADTTGTLQNISLACPQLEKLGIHFENPDTLKVHGDSGGIVNKNSESIARLNPLERGEVTTVAAPMMAHYGYSVIT